MNASDGGSVFLEIDWVYISEINLRNSRIPRHSLATAQYQTVGFLYTSFGVFVMSPSTNLGYQSTIESRVFGIFLTILKVFDFT